MPVAAPTTEPQKTAQDKPISPTELRRNLYRILDEVLLTGRAQEITRNGRRLLLVAAEPSERRRRIDEMPRRDYLACTPQELIDTHWDYEAEP